MVGRRRPGPNRNRNAPKVNDGTEQPFKKKPANPRRRVKPIVIDANDGLEDQPGQSSPPHNSRVDDSQGPKPIKSTKIKKKRKKHPKNAVGLNGEPLESQSGRVYGCIILQFTNCKY